MTPRAYVSPARAAAAGEKRQRVIAAAGALLIERTNVATFSMEVVAKAAGVTRLTVYNQFGSRRGLLEAVFDERARQGGLHRIPTAMAIPDPRTGLNRLIQIFCEFWSGDEAVGRLHDAGALDAEFALALAERNERRRHAIKVLVGRIGADLDRPAPRRDDLTDLIFGLTSYPMFRILSSGRTPEATCALITSACIAALETPSN
ncbi:TetR/AcrR family transcriptional regulator [Labrys okinawensis]|uniref:TetR/AcrR family transcriptional regulator n=1 Tax=Labrys okinawensis TaxID=346911 RepID=UPI0039BCFD2E